MALPLFNDVTVYGEAVETFGFEAYGSIDGFGLHSFGLLWSCPNIWTGSDSTLSTSWTASESATTTTWSNAEGSINTTWTESMNAEC